MSAESAGEGECERGELEVEAVGEAWRESVDLDFCGRDLDDFLVGRRGCFVSGWSFCVGVRLFECSES